MTPRKHERRHQMHFNIFKCMNPFELYRRFAPCLKAGFEVGFGCGLDFDINLDPAFGFAFIAKAGLPVM